VAGPADARAGDGQQPAGTGGSTMPNVGGTGKADGGSAGSPTKTQDAGMQASSMLDSAIPDGSTDATSMEEDSGVQDAGPPGAGIDAAVPSTERTLQPMALISVGRTVITSIGDGAVLVDDRYVDGGSWDVAAETMPWAAIDIGTSPSRVAVQIFSAQADAIAAGYSIETSADSNDGRGGTWTTALMVTDNPRANRVHVLDFTGQRWLRVTIRGAATNQNGAVHLNEIGVRDASRGFSDSWIFTGDSITALAFHPGPTQFSGLVHNSHPSYYPVLVNAGVPGFATNDALAQLDTLLGLYPDIQNWVVSYGTNDTVSNDASFTTRYGENLHELIRRLTAANKTVYMPRIPYKVPYDLAPYNVVLDEAVASTGTFAGPDLYAYFYVHQDQLVDGIHPNEQGAQAMNQLWADAVSRLYP
jgi:acyl-CoA thioesterase I